jgi:aminoglycoside phosphotransferase (APT) family kinase protein
VSLDARQLNRSVVRYRMWCDDDKGRPQPSWICIGKVYPSRELGRRTFAVMEQLTSAGFCRQTAGRVRMPEPYAFLDDAHVLLMEEAPGTPLKQLVKKREASVEHMRLFAETLIKLHTCAPVVGAPYTIDDHLAFRCHGLTEKLAEAFPQLASPLAWMIETSRDLKRADAAGMCAVCHGDYHLGQVHVEDHYAWLLDADPLHNGDPAYDVAMVFFTLKLMQNKKKLSGYIDALRDEFVNTYFSRMAWSIAERVPLHEALIHLKRACKRFRFQDEPGWEKRIPEQIALAVDCLRMFQQRTPAGRFEDVLEIYRGCPVTAQGLSEC